MAKIWPVYEGKEPTVGGPWVEMPLKEVIAILNLRAEDFVSDLENTPKFGPQDRTLWHHGHKHVVVEVTPEEARREKWQPGFYLAKATPNEAFRALIQYTIATALGPENVIRADYASTSDLTGRGALRITVVIAPEAVRTLRGQKALDALVALKKRFLHLGEERTPTIEYTTEEELAQDANS
jgi:hypothetical protein